MGQQLSHRTQQMNCYSLPSSNFDCVQHQGILRLRQIPFQNSMRISDQPPLYLENIEVTLEQIIQQRMLSSKLFNQQYIQKLMESLVYTVAFLETKKKYYPDLVSANIYCDRNTFKLLPVSMIHQSMYDLALNQRRFSCLPPQMILRLRQGDNKMQTEQWLKSNIFSLGMVLLEVATLHKSQQCYDLHNYDILDYVINQRLQLVKQLYSSKIHNFISIMLQYDNTLRPSPKQLAVLVNNHFKKSSNITNRRISPIKYEKSSYDFNIRNQSPHNQCNRSTDRSLEMIHNQLDNRNDNRPYSKRSIKAKHSVSSDCEPPNIKGSLIGNFKQNLLRHKQSHQYEPNKIQEPFIEKCSISKIKQEIQKSRRVIEQFEKRGGIVRNNRA